MKKLIISTVCLAASVAGIANANPQIFGYVRICGYVDHIHMSNLSKVQPKIVEISTSGGIAVTQTSQTSFDIRDNQSDPAVCNTGNSGTSVVKFALDDKSFCIVKFTDGPFEQNPSVQAKCEGNLIYQGLSYDGTWSYSYSMIFAQR